MINVQNKQTGCVYMTQDQHTRKTTRYNTSRGCGQGHGLVNCPSAGCWAKPLTGQCPTFLVGSLPS